MAEHNQQFDSFEQWVGKASSWLTRHPRYDGKSFRAICTDAKGRVIDDGAGFMRARDEDAFPVKWRWPDQPAGVEIISRTSQQVGGVTINTTFGRIKR